MNTERKLGTIRRIDNILPIENADAIEIAVFGGWKVVVKKDEFKVNDLVIYIEIDSWVPHTLAPFLTKGLDKPKYYNSVQGNKLKTAKFRGAISQGLALPLDVLNSTSIEIYEGVDVTDLLGIQKWEAEIAAELRGLIKGPFPGFLQKSDQERVQNKQTNDIVNRTYFVTEKLEGTSCTIYFNNGETGVCQRTLEIKTTPENQSNTYVKHYNEVVEALTEYCIASDYNLALQGEIIGPSIQSNIYNLKQTEFRLYNVFNIDTYEYLTIGKMIKLAEVLGCKTVPYLGEYSILSDTTFDDLLRMGEGVSKLSDREREGIVLRDKNSQFSFKIISNRYLLKQKD